MQTSDLKDGMELKLTADVQNPHPDRRKRYDFSAQPVWPAGTRFTVKVLQAEKFVGLTYELPGEIVLDPHSSRYNYSRIHERGSFGAYERILANSEPAEETIDSVMRHLDAANWGYEEVVRALLNQGRITLDDVRQIIEAAQG